MASTKNTIKVWDPAVRMGHWTLVLAFFTAYFFTEDDFMDLHVWAGYVVVAVVCFRLIWGFVGTRHARFADFVKSPAAILRYLRDLQGKRSKRHIGHNPVGGAMIVALLLSLLVTVYSGLALYAVEEHAGPFAGLMEKGNPMAAQAEQSADAAVQARSKSKKRKMEDPREEFWEELHELFSNLTLLLVGLHVAGGLFSSYVYRENLIQAMVTGRKRSN